MEGNLILIGGGGHCRSCIDVIEEEGRYKIIGIIDNQIGKSENILGYPVIGCDADLPSFIDEKTFFLVTVGQINSADIRKRLFENLKDLKAKIATIISPYALVSKHSKVSEGTIIMHRVVVGPAVYIGQNCIINTNADIEHDTAIGNHCHISTLAVINGNCLIGNEVFIGSNAILFQEVKVSNNVLIGAGSIVRNDLAEKGIIK